MNIVIAVKVLILVDDEVLLLQHSRTHPRSPFGNDMPGGIVENNESLKQGLEREILEETSIEVSIAESALRYTSTVHDEKADTVYIHSIFIHSMLFKPKVVVSWEHASYSWVRIEQVKGLHPNYQAGVNFIFNNKLVKN